MYCANKQTTEGTYKNWVPQNEQTTSNTWWKKTSTPVCRGEPPLSSPTGTTTAQLTDPIRWSAPSSISKASEVWLLENFSETTLWTGSKNLWARQSSSLSHWSPSLPKMRRVNACRATVSELRDRLCLTFLLKRCQVSQIHAFWKSGMLTFQIWIRWRDGSYHRIGVLVQYVRAVLIQQLDGVVLAFTQLFRRCDDLLSYVQWTFYLFH